MNTNSQQNLDMLSSDELKAYSGTKSKERIIEMLRQNKIPFHIQWNGWPVTTASAINGTLLKKHTASNTFQSKAQRAEETPGFSLPSARPE